ncbi:hypothetical protein LOAG_08393 [Loa loa]|uniref:G-protein coupled receptors family 1 profile domain-containing protein n=1 Tax=Loa loa TaxID=7209 RepID=A0A1S0TVC7_LOALO|nr:hypothetical protein LOAG_08393 [Loa loa]EFO20095.1 hypothetical protein LOAG_08393 [Loa loa]
MLICISHDRFYSIFFPLYTLNAKKSVQRIITVAWIVSFSISVLVVWSYEKPFILNYLFLQNNFLVYRFKYTSTWTLVLNAYLKLMKAPGLNQLDLLVVNPRTYVKKYEVLL